MVPSSRGATAACIRWMARSRGRMPMASKPDDRTRALSFSSQRTVVQRWFGGEILDHSPGAVRMDFMKSGRAPVLLNHDMRQQVGVMASATIGSDLIGRGAARFGRTLLANDALMNVD